MPRLLQRLQSYGVVCQEVLHGPAAGAQRRARILAEPGRRVVKTVLVRTERCPVVVLLPASRRINFDALAGLLSAKTIALASLAETPQLFSGCEYGVVPGFGRPYRVPTVLDRRLLDEPFLLIPSDRSFADLRVAPPSYLQFDRPLLGDVSEPLRPTPTVAATALRTLET